MPAAGWTTWQEHSQALARTPVVVLGGGTSGEREISLTSSRAIAAALREVREHEVTLPASVQEVEVDPAGRWCVEGVPLSPQCAVEQLPADALYVLGLHGGPGEDGRLQAFLEVSGRRYTGAGPAASAICMDKRRARQAAEAVSVTVAPGRFISREEWAQRPDDLLQAVQELGGPPWFVKPNAGGSSVDLRRVESRGDLAGALESVLATGDDVLVEAGEEGIEVTAGIVGNRGQEPVLLPIVEILPREGAFFDYHEKYSDDGARELCPPEHLSVASAARVQARALAAYRSLGCEGYARVDFIVPPGGVTGDAEPIFLEANTLPGFTARSLLPQAAAATGVDFRGLCLELCARALVRFEDLSS